jgi:hypothetical protein
MSRKLLLGLVTALAALAIVPGASSSDRLSGVVVKVDRGASTVAVARGNGRVVLVRTSFASTAVLGQVVTVHHARLSVLGRADTTRLRGVVVQTSTDAIAISAGGVRLDIDRDGVTRRLPLGARVDLVVAIDDHLAIDRVREIEVEDEDEVEIEDEDEDQNGVVEHDDDRGDDHDDGGNHGGNRGRGGGGHGEGHD